MLIQVTADVLVEKKAAVRSLTDEKFNPFENLIHLAIKHDFKWWFLLPEILPDLIEMESSLKTIQ